MEILNRQFGLAIAYLLPGFIALAGVAPFAPIVAGWLQGGQTSSLGAPVYAVVAAIAAGMIVSCVRWFLVDPIQAFTGVADSVFNARALEERPVAFVYLVESHYRYYQFYANTLVALIWTYAIFRVLKISPHLGLATDIGTFMLCVVLFAGARDALSKYRNRSGQLAAQTTFTFLENNTMTNGIDHHQGNSKSTEKTPEQPKPDVKPVVTSNTHSSHSDVKPSK